MTLNYQHMNIVLVLNIILAKLKLTIIRLVEINLLTHYFFKIY